MARNKSSISKATTYKEIGEYWDSHDLPEDSPEVDFTVELESNLHYFALDNTMSDEVRAVARRHGISAQTLINLWVKEKLGSELAKT